MLEQLLPLRSDILKKQSYLWIELCLAYVCVCVCVVSLVGAAAAYVYITD